MDGAMNWFYGIRAGQTGTSTYLAASGCLEKVLQGRPWMTFGLDCTAEGRAHGQSSKGNVEHDQASKNQEQHIVSNGSLLDKWYVVLALCIKSTSQLLISSVQLI